MCRRGLGLLPHFGASTPLTVALLLCRLFYSAVSHCLLKGIAKYIVPMRPGSLEGPAQVDVRFGSKADMCDAKGNVRFTLESGQLQRNSPATFDKQHSEGTLEPNGSIGIVRSKRIAMQPLR